LAADKLNQSLNFLSFKLDAEPATEAAAARFRTRSSEERWMKKLLIAGVALMLLNGPAAFAQRDEHRDAGQYAQNETRGTPHWGRGDRVPEEFRGDRYAVSDWRALHLRAPQRGFHWVHVGDRYLMVGEKNGEIRELRMEGEIHR
jgi:Ni/Co efflux regulator RcnB